MALLEVLAALAILGSAGLALVALVDSEVRAVTLDARRERELDGEERLLLAHTLLNRTDLDRRIGSREAGDYLVAISRPERTLYRIAVSPGARPDVEDLVTVVFRPDTAHAP